MHSPKCRNSIFETFEILLQALFLKKSSGLYFLGFSRSLTADLLQKFHVSMRKRKSCAKDAIFKKSYATVTLTYFRNTKIFIFHWKKLLAVPPVISPGQIDLVWRRGLQISVNFVLVFFVFFFYTSRERLYKYGHHYWWRVMFVTLQNFFGPQAHWVRLRSLVKIGHQISTNTHVSFEHAHMRLLIVDFLSVHFPSLRFSLIFQTN